MTEHYFLSVRQPWALPIVEGHKPVENRSGGFTLKYRGRLWIQAGREWNRLGLTDARILRTYPKPGATALTGRSRFVRGAIIGHVTVVDIHRAHPGCCATDWAEQEYRVTESEAVTEVVHLVLSDPVKLDDPIPAKGALGIRRADPDLALALDAALEAA